MVVATAPRCSPAAARRGRRLRPSSSDSRTSDRARGRRTGPDARVNLVLPLSDEREWPRPERASDRVARSTRSHFARRWRRHPTASSSTPKFLVGTMRSSRRRSKVNRRLRRTLRRTPVRRRAKRRASWRRCTADKLAPAAAGTEKAAVTAAARRAAGSRASDDGDRDHPCRTAGAPSVAAATSTPTAGPAAFAASFAIAASAAVNAAIPKYSVRLYARTGRHHRASGQPSARAELPLVDLPGAPSSPIATVTEKSIALSWVAPPRRDSPRPSMSQARGRGPVQCCAGCRAAV